jgi:hypothetical protein
MPSPAPRRPSTPRWLVYLLRCSDGFVSTGITNDLPKRLKAHAADKRADTLEAGFPFCWPTKSVSQRSPRP